eukprot:1158122-Pelagomonas_calceolata.AAC.11
MAAPKSARPVCSPWTIWKALSRREKRLEVAERKKVVEKREAHVLTLEHWLEGSKVGGEEQQKKVKKCQRKGSTGGRTSSS